MNTRHVKKDTKTHTKPRKSRRNLFSLDMPTAFDLSKIIKPNPPMEKRKLEAKPSMMYWPLTRYGIKATCSWETQNRVSKNMIMKLHNHTNDHFWPCARCWWLSFCKKWCNATFSLTVSLNLCLGTSFFTQMLCNESAEHFLHKALILIHFEWNVV